MITVAHLYGYPPLQLVGVLDFPVVVAGDGLHTD